MVLEYEIVDHHPPRLNLLFLICKEIHKFLSENEENVVAVNCRAGKGRTGTIICCYLIFCGKIFLTKEGSMMRIKLLITIQRNGFLKVKV
jgi:phosphatidylinositol-3,4,5-trisphosphate 3-phosphatase/dual-specificity protein phosphatase PTEN